MSPRLDEEDVTEDVESDKHRSGDHNNNISSNKKQSSERINNSRSKRKKTKKKSSNKNVTDEEEPDVVEAEPDEALSSTKKSTSRKSSSKKKTNKSSKEKNYHHHQNPSKGNIGMEREDPPALRGSEKMNLESSGAPALNNAATAPSSPVKSASGRKSKKKRVERDDTTSKKKIVDVVEDGDENGNVETSQKNHDENGVEARKDPEANGDANIATPNAYDLVDPKRSMDRIYGWKLGAVATLSMTLNAALMVYAHVGLSAVVLSSQPPISEVDPNPTLPPENNSTTPPAGGEFTGACNQADFDIWLNGGEMNRTEHSSFCSLEYNGAGCILNEDCIKECFQTTFGYTEECSVCFSQIPSCGIQQGCAFVCAGDSLSPECQECNMPCTRQLDECLGFPDPTEPPPPTITGKCDAADIEIWNSGSGDEGRVTQSQFCSLQYNGAGCLLDEPCIQECFQSEFGYSAECSTCFSAIPICGFSLGCATACAADLLSDECATCNVPCIDELDTCLGVSSRRDRRELKQHVLSYWGSAPFVRKRERMLQGATLSEGCIEVDVDSINRWYEVYQLTFVDSIQKAWNGDAIFLALLIIVFSGIWPYAKNIILIFTWYAPLTVERRDSILTWLLRLSKYTLVDVFAVVAVLVGVQLELNIAGATVVTRAEPRPSIIAFFVATLWEFVQIEWTVHLHNRHVRYDEAENDFGWTEDIETSGAEGGKHSSKPTNDIDDGAVQAKPSDGNFLMAMRFRTELSSNKNRDSVAPISVAGIYAWIGFLLLTTIVMFLSGALTELVEFTTSSIASSNECVKSYNLVSFGGGLINSLSLNQSDSPAGTWTLYLAYIFLVVFLPIVVHTMQICVLAVSALTLQSKTGSDGEASSMKKCKEACHVMSSLFGFSSIEVLLIGIFAVQHKFEDFVAALAGSGNDDFFSITSSIGNGFYILIVYSLASGLLQYFIHCCETEYFKIDPYHKVHIVWTKLFRCWLKKA